MLPTHKKEWLRIPLGHLKQALGKESKRIRQLSRDIVDQPDLLADGVLEQSTALMRQNRCRFGYLLGDLLELEMDITGLSEELADLDAVIQGFMRISELLKGR